MGTAFAPHVARLDVAVGLFSLLVGAVNEIQQAVVVEVHAHGVLPLFDVLDALELGDSRKELCVGRGRGGVRQG